MGTEIIRSYFPALTVTQIQQIEKLYPLYKEWNEKINVISRKDMDNFYERHVLHSLSVAKYVSFQPGTKVLDFGTGGGFPGIPLAILFPETHFHLVDSIGKKITVVNEVVKSLQLSNITTGKSRVEELKSEYDFITCRAVTELATIIKWTKNLFIKEPKDFLHRTSDNQFIKRGWLLLKGGDVDAEIKSARIPTEKIPLSGFFREDFFSEKYLLYIQR